jgi:hypothetical protein
MGSARVGGSLIGGINNESGHIHSNGDMGSVRIGRDLVGAGITGLTADLFGSGSIESNGRIGSVFVGGSIVSGIDTSTAGSLTNNASIRAADDTGSLTVRGSLIGNSNPDGDSPVIISARGQAAPGATTDVAIGKISIGKYVENARILAGYSIGLSPVNGDAQIGAVTVGGDWVASTIVAGVHDGADDLFGTVDDAVIAGGTPGIVSRITSIKIGGAAYGTPAASGADHFGFVAQQIGSFKCLGYTAALTPGTDAPLELTLTTNDVTVREVA